MNEEIEKKMIEILKEISSSLNGIKEELEYINLRIEEKYGDLDDDEDDEGDEEDSDDEDKEEPQKDK